MANSHFSRPPLTRLHSLHSRVQPPRSTPSTPVPLCILGAAHSGATELHQALLAKLGADAVRRIAPAQGATAALLDLPPGATVVLAGLDWPCPDTELESRLQEDTQLRALLQRQAHTYRVIYGTEAHRLAAVLALVQPAHQTKEPASPPSTAASTQPNDEESPLGSTASQRRARMRAWGCEKCSDPECEHRLFTSLRETTPQ